MSQVRSGPSAYSAPIGSPLRPLIDDTSKASKRSFDRGKWTKVALVVVVALVAVGAGRVVMQNMNRTHLQVPTAISGMQLIDDARLAQAVQSLEQIASDNGSTGKAGFYGYNGVPAFFFAAFEYQAGADQSPEDLFREFSGGFATGGTQSVIDLRSKTSDTVGEATYICAKLKGKPSGSICMWADSDIVGFVGAFGQSTKTAESLTAAVRTSVEI